MIRTEGRWRGGKTIRVYPAITRPSGGTRHRPGDAVPDGRPWGFEALVAAYRAGYPDEERRRWIERRLWAWRAGQP